MGKSHFIPGRFKSVPATAFLEETRAALIREYQELNEFRESKELADFQALEQYLASDEHRKLMESIRTGIREEEDKKARFEKQKRSKPFRNHFRFEASEKLKWYNTFLQSKELKDFLALESLIQSDEFRTHLRSLEEELAGLEQEKKSLEDMKRSGPVKAWFRFRDSAKLKRFHAILASSAWKEYEDLSALVDSPEFRSRQKAADPKEFPKTDDGRKLEELKRLQKSGDIRFCLKFRESKAFRDFTTFEASEQLKRLEELEKKVTSNEFRDREALISREIGDAKAKITGYEGKRKKGPVSDFYRFGNSLKYKAYTAFAASPEMKSYLGLEQYLASEEYRRRMETLRKQEAEENERKREYEVFRGSQKYKWYLQVKDSGKFDELKRWQVVFDDDFSTGKLDRGKWLTRYYWGDKLMNDAYVLEHDRAFLTDGRNLELSGSLLKIHVRREKATGKIWKPPFGFIPGEFDYTSGLVGTGHSFRMKYGRIEAKIRLQGTTTAQFHFWLASDRMLPQVDIMKSTRKRNRVATALHWGDPAGKNPPQHSMTTFSGLNFSSHFFIYSLDWSPDRIVWKINGMTVHEQTTGVPQEEMYPVFSATIPGDVKTVSLPAQMEIDWIRCYRKAE